MKCMNCGGTHDVIDFYTKSDDYIILCGNCREKLVLGSLEIGKVGRPSMGTTKKVSLTLSDDDWDWFDDQAKGNRSQFLRYLIAQEQSPEGRWSNYAALGYTILACKDLGYTDEQIEDLVRGINRNFDMKTVDEAKKVYTDSSY